MQRALKVRGESYSRPIVVYSHRTATTIIVSKGGKNNLGECKLTNL